MEKTSDTFGRLKYWLPQNFPFYAKIFAAGRANNIELLILVLDLSEMQAEKCSRVFLWNAWNILTRMHRRKNDTFYTSSARDTQIATQGSVLKLLLFALYNNDIAETI